MGRTRGPQFEKRCTKLIVGRKVSGSIPGGVTGDFFSAASNNSMCSGSTQPLKMM
jgi:hypothetical protein